MSEFEYKVVPAPIKGAKAKGVKTPEARFAHAVELMMNEMAADGWEYLRADMLPSEERSGLTGSTTHWRNLLVFRRARPGQLEEFQPRVIDVPAPEQSTPERQEPPPLRPTSDTERISKNNGFDELSDGAGITAALKARAEAAKSQPTQPED